MIKILLGLVVLAFIFMGAGSFNAGRTNKAASVNGEPISIKAYQQAYQNMVERLRQRFGGRLDNEMLKMLNVREQAMNQVIEAELLRQTAEEYEIQVSAAELAENIAGIPAFQQNGRFSRQRYEMVLNQNRLSPAAFETMHRESLMLEKLRALMASGIQVSESEARQWYNWQNSRVKIHYALFEPKDFTDVPIDAESMKTYYENHKNDYKTKPRIKARYIHFKPSGYLEAVEVSRDAVEAYYRENQEDYSVDETVKARHILLKLPQDADPSLVSEKRQKAVEIMEEARSGKDFAELAKARSEGPTREKGGDLGSFTREDMVKPFSDKAFSMKPGEISEPVRTRFGWHIIKVEDRTEAHVKPLAEVEEEIRESLSLRQARDRAYDEAVAMYNTSFGGEDLVTNSQGREDVSVETTGFFTRQEGPEGVESPAKFAKTAFQLPLTEVSDVVEIGDGFYLIQAIERQEASIPEFETVREQVKKDLKRQRQREAAEEAAREFLETAAASSSIQAAGETASMEVRTTEFFKRNQSIPGIGREKAVLDAAFSLTEARPLHKEPEKGQKGFYVISLAEKETPEPKTFAEEKDRVVQQLAQQKKNRFMDGWISELREKSDIEISRHLIN
jgi:peptidyl-prolyl cis-trans isomerase D